MKKLTFTSTILPALVIFSVFQSPFLSHANEDAVIRIHGSDLFSTWLPDYFDTNAGHLNIDFNLAGSHSGRVALQKQHAEASISIQTTPSIDIPKGFESIQIGHYVLYLHAHRDFPSPEISKDTIARIAQISNPISVDYWREVFDEVNDDWKSTQAEILIDQTQDDFALSFFRLAFLNSQKPSIKVNICIDQNSLESNMNRNKGCIIVSSKKQSTVEHLRPIQLSNFNDPTSFPPTRENIQYSDYSAAFPILLIIPQEAIYKKALLNVFQQQQFKQAMKKHHLLPSL